MVSLGAEGIAKAGGRKGLSEKYKVNLGTLKSYLDKNSSLTVMGERFLGVELNKITPAMLTEIVLLLNAEGIAKTRGRKGLSEKYKVNLSTLKSYLDKNGMLTMRGMRFLETR